MTSVSAAEGAGHRDYRAEAPVEFARALDDLRAVRPRAEISLEEMPGPSRLAPHAAAFGADVAQGERELANGRLVLLHDPQGQEGWEGTTRLVTYFHVDLEPELAADPLIVQVGWSWLTDALRRHGAAYRAAAGTVTRAVSESFGALADRPDVTELELRASWTPTGGDCGAHARAWCDVLATAAGLPPVDPEVAPLRGRSPR